MKLSVLIPAHNEEGCIEKTVKDIHSLLKAESIPHEILVVNDNSQDKTQDILDRLKTEIEDFTYYNNEGDNGYGHAVRYGLERFNGDCVVITMADASDPPKDILRFYKKLLQGYDCVFGTRFKRGGKAIDYPFIKLILNRLANTFISLLFQFRYNDVTNGFKMYRAQVIKNLKPMLSHHFNLTVELPLKAIIRGHSYAVVPNTWINRAEGESKFKIKEMGSRYLFIIIYCFIEKWLSRGDYKIPEEQKKLALEGSN